MNSIWCVRADFGKYTNHFLRGGYIGVGWIPNKNLAEVETREEIELFYREAYPMDKSNVVVGQQVGQIARFLIEIDEGDYVITPSAENEWLHYGKVQPNPSYFYSSTDDGCHYRHRRKVTWYSERIRRSDLSVPFQNTMRSSLTVFSISQEEEFFSIVGIKNNEKKHEITYDAYKVVIDQILELDDKEFEILVGHLLSALGFEGADVTGRPGDGGVDATGELDVSGLAKIKIYVQAKRYKHEAKIQASVVKQLRQAIPFGGQGAFITTASYQKAAAEIALEQGFPRIGLINGRQLVDLLIEHWVDIPKDFQEKLGLQPGLVKI